MRVLLIRPPVPPETIGLKHLMICEPLELEYVAAGLVGHEVEIFDMILERGLRKRLESFSPDLIGTTCYINGVNEVKRICRMVKAWRPTCSTVVGGVHAAVAPEDFADPAIDCVVVGDGTSVIGELARALQSGASLEGIPGLAIPNGSGHLKRTEPSHYMCDPDKLPMPRRDLVKHLAHRYYYLFHQPVALMKTTWGCWYQCHFCMTWRVTGGTAFSRSAESIVAELETIPQKEIYIVDDIFLSDPARLRTIADLIRARNIRKNFLVYGRSDFIADHEDIVAEWSGLGLKAVIVGLEATSDPELVDLHKRCTLDQNRRAIEVLKRHQVDIYASFIVQPDWTEKDWRRLQAFIDDAGLYYVNISPLTPFPGAPMWKQYAGQLSLPRSAHGLWDLTHPVTPTTLPLQAFYRHLIRTYARTVLNARRASRLALRTLPPIWSFKYLRLWLGAVRIYLQLRRAHKYHQGPLLAKAQEVSLPALGTPIKNEGSDAAGSASQATMRNLDPVDPFDGYFSNQPWRERTAPLVAEHPAAERWFDIFTWGMATGLYTFQQPLSGKSGPRVTVQGREFISASSYDYLGLIGHPAIEAAAHRAIDECGTGSGGVRLLTGTNELHRQLESELAAFKECESAILFSSGYAANLAAISALFGRGDRLYCDARIHRSIIDAALLAHVSVRTFLHNDPESLEDLLRKDSGARRKLIAVEGIYSMDGDLCPLPEIVVLKEKYGAALMVDEAHSLGVLGATGRGAHEHFRIDSRRVDIWMGALSKAIPSNGGYIAGSQELIYYLQHGSAPFMFSAAPTPSSVAAAGAALQVIGSEPERLARLWKNAEYLREHLRKIGYDTGQSQSPVIPILLGADATAYRHARGLYDAGILATAVVYPAVESGSARLRLCATAAMDSDCRQAIVAAMSQLHDIYQSKVPASSK